MSTEGHYVCPVHGIIAEDEVWWYDWAHCPPNRYRALAAKALGGANR